MDVGEEAVADQLLLCLTPVTGVCLINESLGSDIPDSCDLVALVSGSNYPVVVNANSYAEKLFVNASGGLNMVDETLDLSTAVLRIEDGAAVDFDGGTIEVLGNVKELIPILEDLLMPTSSLIFPKRNTLWTFAPEQAMVVYIFGKEIKYLKLSVLMSQKRCKKYVRPILKNIQ